MKSGLASMQMSARPLANVTAPRKVINTSASQGIGRIKDDCVASGLDDASHTASALVSAVVSAVASAASSGGARGEGGGAKSKWGSQWRPIDSGVAAAQNGEPTHTHTHTNTQTALPARNSTTGKPFANDCTPSQNETVRHHLHTRAIPSVK